MKLLKIMLIPFVALLATGCEKVITADLTTAAPRLVVDASIDWVKNTAGNEQKIVLSTTTGYYSSEFPSVSGAVVTVTNATNSVFNFVEAPGTGQYICTNFLPVIGQTYNLKIILNGETYTASETFTPVPKIEDNIDQNNKGGEAGDEMEITFYYQDDARQMNAYLNSITQPYSVFPELEVEDDEHTNGNLMQESYSHEKLKAGDQVDIKLYGISKDYYNYMFKLIVASGNDGNPFPTIPSAVRGNIVNQTNSKNYALGYFRLAEVATKSYTIK
ncbi:DUF4249 domain-containing protein [Chitinophaga pinensis]|uniref:DUF4249 domain-containing protein n=1 Tax=Chitinophaga pinensis (strain ATCC 43595 / DSM 2588 / LMG 13176 / NBRC 15968 / NCIMB 11800 / UQM 2034) TaxID=485918 RepID=A0A979GNH5_CHIPD|nr:DUF4249 domain-containing protein [Chitinophaga pinensis]ACU59557.1 hypothetical protein Cpin_2063 [Chitinophaga pinensis DSM 2588]